MARLGSIVCPLLVDNCETCFFLWSFALGSLSRNCLRMILFNFEFSLGCRECFFSGKLMVF
jgi:hypothetical protein